MLSKLKSRRVVALCILALVTLTVVCIAAGLWPKEGDRVYHENGLHVDVSNADEGYVIVHADPSSTRLKLRVTCEGVTYTYDLDANGEKAVIPLQMGSGQYMIALYRNVNGNRYSRKADVELIVGVKDENNVFTMPNQYVYYTEESPAVQKAHEICEGLETDREKVEVIREYISKNYLYDYVRAVTISSGYLGDVDGCYEKGMGICQDLAALTACMLRAEGIPTKLVIGYAGNVYHAWNSVLIDGEYERLDITSELKGISSKQEYTVERVY